jgi:chromosome segregation ATPase
MKGYITLQEAADLLGVSRQTVTRRALSTDKSLDGPRTDLDSSLDSRPASIVQGKKRYISLEWVLAEQKAAAPVDGPLDSLDGPLDSSLDSLDSSADRIRQLEKDLLAAQGEAATLRATVAAQEAHIDSLKTALDREQSLHMASLQQRLPADTKGQADTGRSFMNWLKGWGKK